MKRTSFVCIAIVLLIFPLMSINSQNLKMSREFQAALDKGTRTTEGIPGKNYWTNSADYVMDVEVEFENDTTWIIGSAKITYHNNSPDELRMLIFRSYPDFFAKAALRNYYIYPMNEIDQVQYSDMIVNEDTIPSGQLMMSRTSTNLIVGLKTPLGPGEKVNLSVSWKYYMHPRINIRQGVYNNSSIFISYFYPQVAVYDDVYGWDMIDYMGSVEFYNGFNNYEVNVTLPPGYLAWGGGVIQNPEEVYPKNVLARVKTAMKSDELVKIVTADDIPFDQQTKGKITWRFKAEGTPDFTFAASRHHLWDASSLEVEPGRRVFISAVYPPDSKHYSGAAIESRKSIEKLSFESPGVPYPWPQMTVFNSFEGGGGMESPMMVNNGDQTTKGWASEVIYHEIAHSYVPFITGSNERRFAWLDEGWATYKGILWSNGAPGTGKDQFDAIYHMVSGTSNDIPLMVPSYQIVDPNASTFYGYGRSAMAFMVIEDYIGKEKMDKMWNTFVKRWQWKHPQPWDLFAIINEVAEEDLNWLIKPWYYDFAYADLALSDVNIEENYLDVNNVGGLPAPVYITLKYEKGEDVLIYKKADVWKKGKNIRLKIDKTKGLESVSLGNKMLFDTDQSNNSWTK